MSRNPRFDLVLPGVWSHVPLVDEAEMRASIDRVVLRTVGRADSLAMQRRDLRERFLDVASSARSAGGQQLHLCREVFPGVPLPATLVVVWPGLQVRDDEDDEEAVRERLGAVLGPPASDEDEAPLVVGNRPALRRSRLSRGRPELRGGSDAEGDDVREIETVESRVFAIQPGGRVLILSYACGMPALRDDLVAVFDLVSMSLRWSVDDEPAHPVRPGGA